MDAIRTKTCDARNIYYLQQCCSVISSLYVCMVNMKLKYNFVETPRKFSIATNSIRKLESS